MGNESRTRKVDTPPFFPAECCVRRSASDSTWVIRKKGHMCLLGLRFTRRMCTRRRCICICNDNLLHSRHL